MSAGRHSFTVQYGETVLTFDPIEQGYLYMCPQGGHRAYNWIDTESGTRHAISFDEQRRATIKGSLLCSQGCGWHVIIENGVCRDA